MPLYNLYCPRCAEHSRRITTTEKMKSGLHCKTCDAILERRATGASSQVKEVLDNGIMARPVERWANAEEIYKDRSMTEIPDDE